MARQYRTSFDFTIAVTGATGQVGSDVISTLAARGATSVGIARNEKKTVPLKNTTWVIAELTDYEALVKAFDGIDTVFLCSGVSEDMVRCQLTVIRAAVTAGVKRIIKLSALGASPHSRSIIGLWHYIIEQALKQSGLVWTCLRPHAFYQNLTAHALSIREGRLYSAAGDARIPWVDIRDVGDSASDIILERGYEYESPVLTGLEIHSFDDIAAKLSTVYTHRVTHIRETDDEAYIRMRRHGYSAWMASAQIALFQYWREGGIVAEPTNMVKEITGMRPRGLREYLIQQGTLFR
ncbi:MAG: NAD(P)H-binding protein [Bradyrhizobiaceae bacterium]|nr:NAD(P)H-binding protein [Bradyrhizobiaceae bacterium]